MFFDKLLKKIFYSKSPAPQPLKPLTKNYPDSFSLSNITENAEQANTPKISTDNLVVILIDMQFLFVDQLSSGERDRIIPHQISIIQYCAKNNIPIVVLEYNGCGKTIDILQEELQKVKKLKIITKEYDNGFLHTDLDNVLKKLKAKKLFLMGINAAACVLSTAQGALRFKDNYKIITHQSVIAGGVDISIDWYKKNGAIVPPTNIFLNPVYR